MGESELNADMVVSLGLLLVADRCDLCLMFGSGAEHLGDHTSGLERHATAGATRLYLLLHPGTALA